MAVLQTLRGQRCGHERACFKGYRKGSALHMTACLLRLRTAVQRREGVWGAAEAGAGPAVARILAASAGPSATMRASQLC